MKCPATLLITLGLALLAAGSLAGCSDDGGAVDVGGETAEDTSDQSGADTGTETGDGTDADACEAARPALATRRLDVDGMLLLDALDRQVGLRGVNAGGRSKLPPFFPFPFAESGDPLQGDAPPFDAAVAAYFDRVQGWGHDVVRLPFSWDALEPTRGTFDEAWLDRYEAMVEAAGARGLRVIVDFHQDVFARPYCGDGFPIWACPDPIPETPEDCSSWFLGYFQDTNQMAAFDNFWANGDGLRDDFLAMWEHMVARTWPHDNVIGFEIINEPGNGSADEADWAPNVLTPFYEEVGSAMRGWAPGALIFFDGTGIDAVTQETEVELPAGEGFIFAPHFYDGNVFLGGDIGGVEYVEEGLGKWAALRDAWNVPALVGEFGIRSDHPSAADYVRFNFDFLDVYGLHGTLWEYSTTADDWNQEAMSVVSPDGEETAVVDAMVRAYAAAVAGRVTSWSYDALARTGELVYEAHADGVTEIAAPARLYPDGVQAELTGVEGCWAWDAEAGVLVVKATAAGTGTLTFSPAGG